MRWVDFDWALSRVSFAFYIFSLSCFTVHDISIIIIARGVLLSFTVRAGLTLISGFLSHRRHLDCTSTHRCCGW